MGLSREIAALALEGNEKHEAYLDVRSKANEVHAKVVEMRDKVLSIKGAKRTEAREARDLLRQQNRSVRAALLDEKKLEASADAALRALLEKGKVEIGR
jgi:preprotein translocase subunit SecD